MLGDSMNRETARTRPQRSVTYCGNCGKTTKHLPSFDGTLKCQGCGRIKRLSGARRRP